MQQLSIATFGTTAQDPWGYGVIRVGLKLKDGRNQELRLITVPSICEPPTAQPISLCLEKFEHLRQLDLADCSNGQDPLQIEVLNGADYYWELVTGRTSRCEDGPVAVHTRLGWVGTFWTRTQDEAVQELHKPPDHTHPTCGHSPE